MPEVSKNIITLTGLNSFALRADLDQRVDNFVKKHGQMAVERIDAFDIQLNQLREAMQGTGLFSQNKLIVIKDISENKALAEKIENILDLANESIELVVVEPSPDRRSKFYKTLQKRTRLVEFPEPSPPELIKWLIDEADANDLRLSRANAQYLLDKVDPNQQRLSGELQKLILLNTEITKQAIDDLVVPTLKSNIFDLLSAAFSGQTKRALELYQEQRLQRVEPGQILAMFAWQMHAVALIDSAKGITQAELSKESSINPYVLSKSRVIADKLDRARIESILDQLADIDWRIKNRPISADDALKNLIISLT